MKVDMLTHAGNSERIKPVVTSAAFPCLPCDALFCSIEFHGNQRDWERDALQSQNKINRW